MCTATQRRNSPARSVRRSFTPWHMCASTWSVSPCGAGVGRGWGQLSVCWEGQHPGDGRGWGSRAQMGSLPSVSGHPGKLAGGNPAGTLLARLRTLPCHGVQSTHGKEQLSLDCMIPRLLAQSCLGVTANGPLMLSHLLALTGHQASLEYNFPQGSHLNTVRRPPQVQ